MSREVLDQITEIFPVGAYISNGVCARVYRHPTDWDKVIKVSHEKEDGTKWFLQMIFEGKLKGEHYVKVYEFYDLSMLFPGAYVAVLERLSEAHDRCDTDTFRGEQKEILADLKDQIGLDGERGNDLHKGNVMMRGDTIVITDPWYSPYTSKMSTNILGKKVKLIHGKGTFHEQHIEREEEEAALLDKQDNLRWGIPKVPSDIAADVDDWFKKNPYKKIKTKENPYDRLLNALGVPRKNKKAMWKNRPLQNVQHMRIL